MKFGDGTVVELAARRWSRLWTPQVILCGALLSVLVSVATVDVFGHYLEQRHQWSIDTGQVLGHVAGFAFFLLTGGIVAGAVLSAFRRGDTRGLLITVFVSYFSLILVFASVYYEAAFFGDFQDAVFKYNSYRYDGINHIPGPFYESRRSFFGIEPRFWSGVDWPVRAGLFPNGLPPGAYQVPTAEMRRIAAENPPENVIQFVPEARLAIFADCLHFSVITMTTVGYGDITPRSLAARLAADVEAVSNTLLLIFGVGIILGTRKSGIAGPPPSPPLPPDS